MLSSLSRFFSLSMEYHPKYLSQLIDTNNNPEDIPKPHYLQCPGGVKIKHLEKFLISKFNLNANHFLVDIVYETEVLPKEFNLMDVGYCYNYRRVSAEFYSYYLLPILAAFVVKLPGLTTEIFNSTKDAPMTLFYKIYDTQRIKPEFLEPLPPKAKSSRQSAFAQENLLTKFKEEADVNIVVEQKVPVHSISLKGILRKSVGESEANTPLVDSKPKPVSALPKAAEHSHQHTQQNLSPKRNSSAESNINSRKEQHANNSRNNGDCGGLTRNVSSGRSPDKRRSRDEFEFVDEINNAPESTKRKCVKFNEKVVPISSVGVTNQQQKYANPKKSPAAEQPKKPKSNSPSTGNNDFKRLRSNDFAGTKSNSNYKTSTSPTNSTSSSSSSTSSSSSSSSVSLIPISSSTSSNSDSSKTTTGTAAVPDSKFKQFTSISELQQQQLQTPPKASSLSKGIVKSSNFARSSLEKVGEESQLKGKQLTEELPTVATTAKEQKFYLNKKSANKSNADYANSKVQEVQKSNAVTSNNNNDLMTDVSTKYEYAKNIGLKPIHEVINITSPSSDKVRVDKNKNQIIDYGKMKEERESSSGRKRKKSKHSSKDFPFADTKKKKTDYGLTITTSSSSSVPKMGVEQHHHHHHQQQQSSPPSSESLKMKIVKVVNSKPTHSAKVVLINSSGSSGHVDNKSKEHGSADKSPPKAYTVKGFSPPKSSKSSSSSSYIASTSLSNFIIKDNSMEIRHVAPTTTPMKKPTPPQSPKAVPVNKPPSPPSAPAQQPQIKESNSTKVVTAVGGGNLKRTMSVDQPLPKLLPPLKQQKVAEKRHHSAMYLQRSNSFDPSQKNKYINMSAAFHQQQMLNNEFMLRKQFQQTLSKQGGGGGNMMNPAIYLPPPSPVALPKATVAMGSKKPIPPLLPPSYANFSKPNHLMLPNLMTNKGSAAAQLETPPMVEIVRLPPGLDKIDIQAPVKTSKASRPPPPPIPLVKIRKAGSAMLSNFESGNSGTKGKEENKGGNSVCDDVGALDLSGKSSRSPTLEIVAVKSNESQSQPQLSGGLTNAKPKSSLRPILPVPQLNEISKINRAGSSLIRQQSASVRNVPNPSALALRNQIPTILPKPATDSSSSPPKTVNCPRPTLSPLSSQNVNNAKQRDEVQITITNSGGKSEGTRKSPVDKAQQPPSLLSSQSSAAAATQKMPPQQQQTSFTSKSCNLEKLASKIMEGAVTLSSVNSAK